MAVLRLLCLALPIAAEEPRKLAFSFGKVQMSGNGVSNSPLGQMSSVWNNAGNSLVQPGQQPNQNAGGGDPFGSGGFGGGGPGGPTPFNDDPFASFGNTPKQPSGMAVTPQNGAMILRGMIRSFLAKEHLQQGEEQCLEQGCSALGSEASAVAQNVVMIGESIMTVGQIGKDGDDGKKPEDPMKAMMGGLSDMMNGGDKAPAPPPASPQMPSSAGNQNPLNNFFSGVFGQGTNPSASKPAPAPAATQNANVAMNMFNWAQGRRLQFANMGAMGGMGMGGAGGGGQMDPMMMMGGAAMAAQLAKQVKDLSDMAQKVSERCLQGDAKATFALAVKRAQDPGWLEKAMISQGPAEMGVLADAMTAYKKGDAAGFGDRLGSSLRKILLTDPDNFVTQKLPDQKTLPNVTGGFMKGFFGKGMTATITTPEEPNGINIDLNKCVGRNVGLFQGVWASIMKFYQGQGMPTTEAEKQQQASLLAYFAMQMPRVMKLCNIDSRDIQALKDAAAGMGKGVNFQMHIPSNPYSKSEAMSDMAQTVSGYSNLVQNPASSVEFGQNLGKVFQNALEGSMSQKYFVDAEGNLRLRQLSTGPAGTHSMLTPALLVLIVVLLLLVLLAVKSRRALQGWKEHVCQIECSEAHIQSKAESLDVEASEIKPILDEVR